jgi:hypothetical protein
MNFIFWQEAEKVLNYPDSPFTRKREPKILWGFLDARFRGHDINQSFSASC